MSSFPPTISSPIGSDQRAGVFGRTKDPARYVIGRSRFQRPILSVPNGPSFEWPNGIEGLRVAGQVGNARHKYIGDNAEVVQVMHRDARTIEMSGMFTGITAEISVRDLLSVITAVSPTGYWILTLLGSKLTLNQQHVNIDNYEFTHEADDRTDSWNYNITFIRVGIGAKPKPKPTVKPPANPITKTGKPGTKGKGPRTFTIRAGARTLRAVAQVVFHNPERWKEIYNLNVKALNGLNIPLHTLPTKNLPLGLKLYY